MQARVSGGRSWGSVEDFLTQCASEAKADVGRPVGAENERAALALLCAALERELQPLQPKAAGEAAGEAADPPCRPPPWSLSTRPAARPFSAPCCARRDGCRPASLEPARLDQLAWTTS
jgi:hypothetical protein